MIRSVKARMRNGPVTNTFKITGRFFNKIRNGSFSSLAIIFLNAFAQETAVPVCCGSIALFLASQNCQFNFFDAAAYVSLQYLAYTRSWVTAYQRIVKTISKTAATELLEAVVKPPLFVEA